MGRVALNVMLLQTTSKWSIKFNTKPELFRLMP